MPRAPKARGRSLARGQPTDPETGVAPGMTQGRNMRSRYRCSMCPAIHINSRSWLRSSSTHEPSDPPLRVIFSFHVTFRDDDQPTHNSRTTNRKTRLGRSSPDCGGKQDGAPGNSLNLAHNWRTEETARPSLPRSPRVPARTQTGSPGFPRDRYPMPKRRLFYSTGKRRETTLLVARQPLRDIPTKRFA